MYTTKLICSELPENTYLLGAKAIDAIAGVSPEPEEGIMLGKGTEAEDDGLGFWVLFFWSGKNIILLGFNEGLMGRFSIEFAFGLEEVERHEKVKEVETIIKYRHDLTKDLRLNKQLNILDLDFHLLL